MGPSAPGGVHSFHIYAYGNSYGFRRGSHLIFRQCFHRIPTTFSATSKDTAVDWPVNRVRETFIKYFEEKHEHKHYLSSPVVPINDPTLLFANAGMNQFKPIFIGTVDPTSPLHGLTRAVNSQKCIRAGGKHNDLDDVGKDTYHHTFFEMLGTWSFGNYFKKEAIDWAYDILVNTYKLPVERLYASYFAGDEAQGLPCDNEARDFWLQYLPLERVLPFDKKANFWEMGETGPCGPCSEIHFDRIGGRDASALVNADDPDVIEIWNLVFIQFNREANGELRALPNKHIDTGMGLERLTSILQSKRSNYDTDAFTPLFAAIEKTIGCSPYSFKLGPEDAKQGFKDMAYRVIADHIRTLTFAITDGAVPSNEGRGYVLRRILRRAVRYGMQNLGAKPGFFSSLVPAVVESMGKAYPELKSKVGYIQSVLSEEEQSFTTLLERGVKYFNEQVQMLSTKGEKTVAGDVAFFMYDTLGFPLDLTQLMAAESGLIVDVEGFKAAMAAQKERGRLAGREKRLAGRAEINLGPEQISYLQKTKQLPPTDDSKKYEWDISVKTTLEAIVLESGAIAHSPLSVDVKTVGLILNESPFYSESGGQIADSGAIAVTRQDGTVLRLEVVDVQTYGGYVLHTCVSKSESESLVGVVAPTKAVAEVDYDRRRETAPNHSMTHVLNFALRKVLGEDIDQKGSQVSDEKLRFDFSHSRGMTVDELEAVESIVEAVVTANLPVYSEVVPLKQAMEIVGLRAVFGERYPDPVRVVSVGRPVIELLASPSNPEWLQSSIEFCGGTHVRGTGEARTFVITEETSVAKGVRRISAITGEMAVEARALGERLKRHVLSVQSAVGSSDGGASQDIESLIQQIRAALDSSVIPYVLKSKLRDQLEIVSRQSLALRNKQLMAKVDESIQAVKTEAVARVQAGEKLAVFSLEIGSDSKAIKRAVEEIKKVAPGLSFMGLSYETESYSTKITAFALTTDEAQKSGLQANEWVNACLSDLGGRGGGKGALAQGSAVVSTDTFTLTVKENLATLAAEFAKKSHSKTST